MWGSVDGHCHGEYGRIDVGAGQHRYHRPAFEGCSAIQCGRESHGATGLDDKSKLIDGGLHGPKHLVVGYRHDAGDQLKIDAEREFAWSDSHKCIANGPTVRCIGLAISCHQAAEGIIEVIWLHTPNFGVRRKVTPGNGASRQ